MNSRTMIGVTRLGVGTLTLFAPRLSAKVFGLDPDAGNEWIARLFASRELLLALLMLTARDDQVRDVARVGVAVDAIDVGSSVVDWRAGRLSPWTTISGGAGAALFVALGLDVARQAEAQTATA